MLKDEFIKNKTLLCVDYLRGPFGIRINQYWVANETDVVADLNDQILENKNRIDSMRKAETRLEKYLKMPWYKRIFI